MKELRHRDQGQRCGREQDMLNIERSQEYIGLQRRIADDSDRQEEQE